MLCFWPKLGAELKQELIFGMRKILKMGKEHPKESIDPNKESIPQTTELISNS